MTCERSLLKPEDLSRSRGQGFYFSESVCGNIRVSEVRSQKYTNRTTKRTTNRYFLNEFPCSECYSFGIILS